MSGTDSRSSCETACDVLERVLGGEARKEIVDRVLRDGDFSAGLRRLRAGMGAHRLEIGSERIELGPVIDELDRKTRDEGFQVLQSWDFKALRFTEENIPVLMLDYFVRTPAVAREERVSLEILLDYYFLHVLALVVMRAWDEEDPDRVFDRVTDLIQMLQGPRGSGNQFLDDAETLLMLAVSHFHPEEKAYDRLIDKVRKLNERHQTAFSLVSAAVLGSHLRWGLWLQYDRDVLRMREDNIGDYPWLLFAIATLMRDYARMLEEGVSGAERHEVLESLLNGLSADPWAFMGRPPPALHEYEDEYMTFVRLLARHRDALLAEAEQHRPSTEAYSPIALQFNFPNNTLVALVTLALLEGSAARVSLNSLLRGASGPAGEAAEALARKLMDYSGSSPERLGARRAMLVAYDPYTGRRSVGMTLDAVRKKLAS